MIITDNNFDSEVLESNRLVMVDCFAEWCAPCKTLKPLLNEIAEEKDSVKIGFLNIDDNPIVVKRLNITTIPKVVIFKCGEQIAEMLGVRSKTDYQDIINDLT